LDPRSLPGFDGNRPFTAGAVGTKMRELLEMSTVVAGRPPVLILKAMVPTGERAAPAPRDPASMPAPGAHVLLIEDEPGIVDFVRRGLEGHGFEVLAETDGIAGERAALQENVDVVVLDLMLPGRSGMEVLATLRSAKPELPVIVLTARGEVEDRVAGLDAGAVDYLVKPFSLAELSARIRAQLRTAALGNSTKLEADDVE